jgi:ferric-dicitrate binding protein FerR (iron transport regulator)
MDNREFLRILRRYRLGEANEAEKALVEQWYDLLHEGHVQMETQDQELVGRRLWERIEMETGIHGVPEPSRKRFRVTGMAARWTVAASILLAVFTGWWFIKRPGPGTSHSETARAHGSSEVELLSHTNHGGSFEWLTLDDGTRVKLLPGTSLEYPSKFVNARRDVYLKGEAFFEVARDASKPFFVHSGGITTRVLGTSFGIKPLDGGASMEVAVRTGKVEVFESDNGEASTDRVVGKTMNGVVLTPNQRVIYHEENGLFEATLVTSPLPLQDEDMEEHTDTGFVFSDAPLKVLLEKMEKAYGIEIIVEKESLLRCPFSGDISQQNLFEKLDIVNKALGTRCEVKGTRILIKGEGCG